MAKAKLEVRLQAILDKIYIMGGEDPNVQVMFSNGAWGYIDDGAFNENIAETLDEFEQYINEQHKQWEAQTYFT